MKYILLSYDDEPYWENAGPGVHQAALEEAIELATGLKAKGKCKTAAPLYSSSVATCVNIRDGKQIVTDGPFAETREQLGGFYLIDVPTIDEAIAIAEKHPGVRHGTVEVRPILEIPGLPVRSA
jgi:hypothetical protein